MPRSAGARGGLRIARQAAFDVGHIAAHRRGKQAVGGDRRIAIEDAPRQQRIAVPGVAQDQLDALFAVAIIERQIVERGFERDPAVKAVFARHGVLDVAQGGFSGRIGPGSGQSRSRGSVTGAHGLQPAFGVFFQGVERCFMIETFGRRLGAHGKPSFHCQTSAYERPEDRFVRSFSEAGRERLPCRGQAALQWRAAFRLGTARGFVKS